MKTGLHQMTMPEYLAIKALSSGLVHTILTASPCHAKAEQDTPSEPTEVSETGVAVHDGLLEGLDRIVAVEANDWRTNAAKAAREQIRAEGKIPMLAAKVGKVRTAIAAAKSHIAQTELRGIFEEGESEVTYVWQEGVLLCKARADRWNSKTGILLHVKTTGSAAPGAFSRVADSMGYDLAVMFYERGMEAVAPGKLVKSYILAIEQEFPHGCKLYDLHELKKEIAASRVEQAIQTWAECAKTGVYPAYGAMTYTLEPKPWQLAEAEATGMVGGLAYHEPDPLQAKHGMQI